MASIFGQKLEHQIQDPESLELTIFTPVNCSKIAQLKQVSGCCRPEREVIIQIDDYEVFTAFSDATGRFDVRNPYYLPKGYHTVTVACTDGGKSEERTAWLFIQD